MVKIIIIGFQFICLQEPLVSIRKHKNQISSTNRGMKSILYSTCALTCFYLRKKNVLDPSDIYNQEEFDIYFKKLVILNLTKIFLLEKKAFFCKTLLFNIIPYPLKKFLKIL